MSYVAIDMLRSLQEHGTADDLKRQASVVAEIIDGKIGVENAVWINDLCKRLAEAGSGRVTVLLPSGQVLGDSAEDPERMDDHSLRPEVKSAKAGLVGSATRYSVTLDRNMMYVAVPLLKRGAAAAIVRASMPVAAVTETLEPYYLRFGLAVFLVAFFSAVLSLYLSHRIEKPVSALTEGVGRFAGGDLNYRLRIEGAQELAQLAQAMNNMASELREKLQTITRQRNELEALLSNMVEGVMFVNCDERIVRINPAAGQLLRIEFEDVEGRNMVEAIRNTALHEFVKRALRERGSAEDEICILGESDRYLQAHGTVIEDQEGRPVGVLVVLNDVTKLKTVELIKRDFVSNVSHELKTPVTSIRGFLETLRDGALDDPEDSRRFLDIIIKHTDRVSAIVEDLLRLSRIEREEERGQLKLEESDLFGILRSALDRFGQTGQSKGVSIELDCTSGLVVKANRPLLEQAVASLADNAMKHSQPGSTVVVKAFSEGDQVIIRVIDSGTGIGKGDLPRIFERFYRVDKGRSREKGGTGLGLAIVKHIVNAHGGRIKVESSPGRGSTFSIHLPNPAEVV